MSRPRTGTVAWRRNVKTEEPCWHARWTRADGSRTNWVALDPKIPESDRDAAEKCAASFASVAKATTKDGAGETVAAYSTRWLAQRAKGTAKDNGSHLKHHVLPVIGQVSILRLLPADGDALVAALDKKIEAGMSNKTARNVWGTIGRMLRDAAHAKPSTGLRCLEVNPFRDVQPPERSKVKKAKQFLYPNEFLAFVSCPSVPVRWKRNVALATYLGERDGEQRAHRWPHIDLEHGIANVCETTSKGETREGTKTDAPRRVPIPAALLPLLEEMHEASGGEGLVCRGIASQRAMARGLRTWLRKALVWAGIPIRPELFESTSVNLNLRWHDLRATCGTWLAVEGRSATEIRDVLGHTQTSMTDRYMRDASAMRSGQFGLPFPPLPEFRQRSVMTKNATRNYAESNELLRGGRDSKTSTANADLPIAADDRVSAPEIVSSPVAPIRGGSTPVDGPSVTSDADIGSAIDRLTKALATADDEKIGDLVGERKALRAELEERRRARSPNVISLRQSKKN
jgi:integrase